MASTIAHDSHNIVVVGDSDDDMLAAVKAIEAMQGGLVLVRNGRIVKSLTLEIAGLMTNEPAPISAVRKTQFINSAHELFHVKESMPGDDVEFLAVSCDSSFASDRPRTF